MLAEKIVEGVRLTDQLMAYSSLVRLLSFRLRRLRFFFIHFQRMWFFFFHLRGLAPMLDYQLSKTGIRTCD